MNYYTLLGVNQNATHSEIKSAYRQLAKQHHPDMGGNEELFKQINEAYATLSDPVKRSAYDTPQNNFNFNSSHFNQGHNPFGYGAPQSPRNTDVTIAVNVTLEEIVTGKDVIATYNLRSGRQENVNIVIPKGARANDTIRYQGLGDDSIPGPRGNLNVRVKVLPHPIFDRDGDILRIVKKINVFDLMIGSSLPITAIDGRELKIKIPKGTRAGATFSVPECGLPNINTGRRGSMYVIVDPFIPAITDPDIESALIDIRRKMD